MFTSDFERKPSQYTNSVKPTTSLLQTRPFAPLQTDENVPPPQYRHGYSENILKKLINQHNPQSPERIQAKPKDPVRAIAKERMAIQAKLNIGEPNDKYEKEADVTAARVVQQINSPSQELGERQKLQMKPMKPLLQRRKDIAKGEASSDLESSIQSARGHGQSLDKKLQRSMGQAMGADFSGVRVHTDAKADQLNKSIQAKAFTTGQDVFFRQGAYEPKSRGGQELIAHELTHVVQNREERLMRSSNEEEMKGLKTTHNEEEESKTDGREEKIKEWKEEESRGREMLKQYTEERDKLYGICDRDEVHNVIAEAVSNYEKEMGLNNQEITGYWDKEEEIENIFEMLLNIYSEDELVNSVVGALEMAIFEVIQLQKQTEKIDVKDYDLEKDKEDEALGKYDTWKVGTKLRLQTNLNVSIHVKKRITKIIDEMEKKGLLTDFNEENEKYRDIVEAIKKSCTEMKQLMVNKCSEDELKELGRTGVIATVRNIMNTNFVGQHCHVAALRIVQGMME